MTDDMLRLLLSNNTINGFDDQQLQQKQSRRMGFPLSCGDKDLEDFIHS
jgi:hypothetical protein